MRYLFIFLLLNSCVQDCTINPTMEKSEKPVVKGEIKTNKNDLPNLQELREQIRPGGQLGCKF